MSSHWTFKAGIGFDQTPVTTAYRTVQAPDGDRYVTAVGAHYQADKAFGVDFGWAHFFLRRTRVNSSVTVGPETSTVDGLVSSYANVYGLQLTYKI